MPKSLQQSVRGEQRGPSLGETAPLRSVSFSRPQVEAFKKDPSQGLSRITAAYKRALQRVNEGSITRKELKQLANNFRNYAHDIGQSDRRSAQRTSNKIESMARGLDKRASSDLGPSAVRPISEIFNPELEKILRTVASNGEVKKALNTSNADNAFHQLRHGSHYTTTPSGATVIFLASLESGRLALVEQAEKTRCEASAPVVAMTPREGLTLITHYLPNSKGLQIKLNEPLHVNGPNPVGNSFLNRLLSYNAARVRYCKQFGDEFKNVARAEGREDLAQSEKLVESALHSPLVGCRNAYELASRLLLFGVKCGPDLEICADLFVSIEPDQISRHLSPLTIESLAQSAGVDPSDPQACEIIADELRRQPWHSIAAPDQVTFCSPLEDAHTHTEAPDSSWSIGVFRAHVHPLLDSSLAEASRPFESGGYNLFSQREVTKVLHSRGILELVSAEISKTEKFIEDLSQSIRRHASEVQSARELVQSGDLAGALSLLNELLESSSDKKDAIGRYPLSLRFNGVVTHSHVSSEIAIHEALLDNAHKRVEGARTRLQQYREAATTEDVVGILFAQPRGGGTFQESWPDVLSRRAEELNPALNQHGVSLQIIENPFGSLYAVADKGNAITNLRYEGPGERQSPGIGLDRWLDGDRLTKSEIVRSFDHAKDSPAQTLDGMVIYDLDSGMRRFAMTPRNILSWLITNRRSDMEESLGHPLPATMRTVAGEEYLFVDWSRSGTLQPENIRKITALLREHAVHSVDSNAVLSQLDRMYRAAPDYETQYPLHASMPNVCTTNPDLMERYLTVATTIAERGTTLPPELPVILKSLESMRFNTRVERGIELLSEMLNILTISDETEGSALYSVRQLFGSPELCRTLQRVIEGEIDSPELFPSESSRDEQAGISPPWSQRFKAFVDAETSRKRAKEEYIAAFLAGKKKEQSTAELEDLIVSPPNNPKVLDDNAAGRATDPSEFLFPPEYASDLRRDGKFDPDFAREVLRRCLRNVVEREGKIDPEDWGFTPPEEGDRSEHEEAKSILTDLLAGEFNQFLPGATPADPYQEATQKIQAEFRSWGHVDLQRVLGSYDGSIEEQNVGLHLAIAREIAGRMVSNIPPQSATSYSNVEEAVLLKPSYELIREDLFARVYDDNFPQQMEELVASLYQRDKVVRFWDLAVAAENDPAAAAKFNEVLLQALLTIPENPQANSLYDYFVAPKSL